MLSLFITTHRSEPFEGLNILDDLKFLQSGSWHFWYQTSSFRSTTILQKKMRSNEKGGEFSKILLNVLYIHDVVASVKPFHILTPAVFGNVVDKQLFCCKVVPPSDACWYNIFLIHTEQYTGGGKRDVGTYIFTQIIIFDATATTIR